MKKFFIGIIGGTVVLFGLLLVVLPGPGVLVIGGGLAILATQFLWAKRALRNAKGAVAKVRRRSGFRDYCQRRYKTTPPKPEMKT